MQAIDKSDILEFHPDTLEAVRRAFHLDGRLVERSVQALQEWVNKQSHFMKKDYSLEYLERVIIAAKGSLQKSKRNLDRLCTLRSLIPYLFEKSDVKNDMNSVYDVMRSVFMPKMTEDNYRILVVQLTGERTTTEIFRDFYKSLIILTEYMKLHEYCQGFIIILDHREANILDSLSSFNLIDARNIMTVFLDGYGIRIKGIHIVTPSKMVDKLLTLSRQFLTAKLLKRIHTHRNLASLHQHVPRHVLPEDLGGEQTSVAELQERWLEVLSTKKHVEYVKMMSRAGTDEAHRQTDKFNEECLGMPGSFRALTVD